MGAIMKVMRLEEAQTGQSMVGANMGDMRRVGAKVLKQNMVDGKKEEGEKKGAKLGPTLVLKLAQKLVPKQMPKLVSKLVERKVKDRLVRQKLPVRHTLEAKLKAAMNQGREK